MKEYIDEISYEALKNNTIEETNSEWDPYFIKITGPLEKTVQLKTKPYGSDVIKLNLEADKDNDNNLIGAKDDKIIEELNKELDKKTFNSEPIKNNVIKLKEFLEEKKEKNERTEKSQESKQNSDRVQVGQIWKYKGKNGKTLRGVVSEKQEHGGELIKDVTLEELIQQKKGGKRKSKKSKKSKTRKNSRKTNRHRR